MKVRVIALVRSLLEFWVINFVLIGAGMALAVFIGIPLVMMILTKTVSVKLFPSWDDIYKTIDFVVFAAFWSGLVLWAKEEFFTKRNKEWMNVNKK